MSEKPYRVHKHTDNILDVIKCGNRHVLLVTGSSDAYLITQVLNKEIAPMIEALEEKSLENMQLNERIAELEAVIKTARDQIGDYLYSANSNVSLGSIEKLLEQAVENATET